MPQDPTLNHEIKRPPALDARVKQIDLATYGVLMHVPEAHVSSEAAENSVPFVLKDVEREPRPEEVIEKRIIEGHETNAQQAMQAEAQAQLAEIYKTQSEN